MYMGTHTLADCKKLALAMHPSVRGLRTAFTRVRPAWQAKDLFGAERYHGDLTALERRWATAVSHATAVRPSKVGGESMTFAARPFDKMVRALRVNGMSGVERTGDLSNLTRRLKKVYGRVGRFGDDALGGVDAVTSQSSADLMSQYGPLIAALTTKFNALKSGYSATQAQAAQTAIDKLNEDWRALSVYGSDENDAQYAALMNVLGEYAAAKVLIPEAASMGDDAGVDIQNKPAVLNDANAPITAPGVLDQKIVSAVKTAYGDVVPTPEELDTAVAKVKAGLSSANPFPTADELQRAAQAVADAARTVNPFDSPWVKGGLVVVGLGFLAFTLQQIRLGAPMVQAAVNSHR